MRVSVIDNNSIVPLLQFQFLKVIIFILIERTTDQLLPLNQPPYDEDRIITLLMSIIHSNLHFIPIFQGKSVATDVVLTILAAIVVLVVGQSIVENGQLSTETFHVAKQHVVFFILGLGHDLVLEDQGLLYQPLASQFGIFAHPSLTRQLQELDEVGFVFRDQSEDYVDGITLETKGFQFYAVSCFKTYYRFLLQACFDCLYQEGLLYAHGQRYFLTAEQGLKFDYIQEIRSDRLIISIYLGQKFLIKTRKDRPLIILGKELSPRATINRNIRINRNIHKDSIDHHIIAIQMIGRQFLHENISKVDISEPIDDGQGVTY